MNAGDAIQVILALDDSRQGTHGQEARRLKRHIVRRERKVFPKYWDQRRDIGGGRDGLMHVDWCHDFG